MIHGIIKHPWDYYTRPFSIIDNLYYVGNRDVSAYLIDTGKGLIIHIGSAPMAVPE